MNRPMRRLSFLFALCAMAALILDSQTAMRAAAEAIELCLHTAIASLFPFFVISNYIVPYISHFQIPMLEKQLGLPKGWGTVFMLGCIGGYPVGAQCIAQGFGSGSLDQKQAMRMISFCNNCGPSFLFGIVGAFFPDYWFPFAILCISIGSAAIIAAFSITDISEMPEQFSLDHVPLVLAVQHSVRSMVTVCAWIILGKVMLAFLSKWLLCLMPQILYPLLTGLLELTNGCLMLDIFPAVELRFIAAAFLCCFGGLCVYMQVMAICSRVKLDCAFYLRQKFYQAIIAAALAAVYTVLPFHALLRILLLIVLIIFIIFFKNWLWKFHAK